MIPPLHLQTLAEATAARLAECLVEGTLIALCAALVLRLRRQNSGTRFAIWFSALITIAALPFVAGAFATIRNANPLTSHSPITLPSAWALYLFAAWAVIAMLSLSRVAISLYHIRALRRSCTAFDSAKLDPLVRETLKNANLNSVALCTSNQVQIPTAIGFFQPAVVIPTWLRDDLSPQELNQIVLHELAHLHRRDDWTNLIQQIVKALFFFHPAVWWIEKKISLEREMACDDAVIATTAEPRAYAECLTHLAERTFLRRTVRQGIALAQAALGRVRHTTLRVAEILNPNRARAAKPTWKPALSLIAVLAVGSVVLASREPQLIAFQNSSLEDSSAQNSSARSAQGLLHPARFSLGGGNDSSITSPLKPIPASFIAPQTQKSNKTFRPQHRLTPPQKTLNAAAAAPRVQQTNFQQTNFVEANLDAANAEIFAFVIESGFNPSAPTANIHPASFAADSAVSTETIFVITQHPAAAAAGQPLYEIHFWRVTVFHPAAAKPIPNKET